MHRNRFSSAPECPVYGDSRHWSSKLGNVRCVECIPPVFEGAVAEWIEVA